MANLINKQNTQAGDSNVAALIPILQRRDKLEKENVTLYSAIFHKKIEQYKEYEANLLGPVAWKKLKREEKKKLDCCWS